MSAHIHDVAARRLAEVVRTRALSLDDANAVMDAVVPAVVARAKAEALREAADDASAFGKDNNNKLLARVTMRATATWLDARADEIDGGQ